MTLHAPFRASDLGPDDDREIAREDAIERRAEHEADDIQTEVYEWLTERFGENVAIALTDPDGYADAEILRTVHDARADYQRWLHAESERVAIASMED